jgi:peroxiredoxin
MTMTIQVGQKIPSVCLKIVNSEGVKEVSTLELFNDKKSIVFGLPGAFTPVCSARHVPDFASNKDVLQKAGIDQIVCLSVNDAFVMKAWAEQLKVTDTVVMLCDGNGNLTEALGMTLDLSDHGLGVRSKRYAMIIDDCVVKHLEIEETPETCSVSSAEYFVNLLSKAA